MKISVCIPMYNEAAVIAKTAMRLSESLEREFGRDKTGAPDYEIIFADDGSSDGSADVVNSLHLDGVRVISYSPNRGKGYAVRTALLESEGDIAMFTDADLAYGTEVIKTFYNRFLIDPETEVAIGSRNLTDEGYEGYSFIRKLASKTYLKVLALAGGFRLSDSQCGCKAFSHKAIGMIFPRCEVDRFAFDFEALLWAQKLGLKIGEIPVKVMVHGESKVHLFRDTFRMLRDLRKMKKRIAESEI
ncbi:MAG: glycosyltransferase [Clostridia bacterium]|nr:glycosyltransferase [Clostridia bacterium]